MFGQLKVTTILKLSNLQTMEEAVAKLLEFAEYPKILRWFQFPTAVMVFWPLMTRPIAGPSTSTTGSGVSGFGWISMTGTTVGIARRNSMF